ncbi:MAG TPA: glycosyltransferase family 4 protein [Gemmataceae bacterium]|nr:glycosyltransferase family 4 protein [Gemmataceae bacterium]
MVFRYPLTWGAIRQLKRDLAGFRPDVTQTSFLSAFGWPLLWLKLSRFTRKLIVIDHSSGTGPDPRSGLAPLRQLRRWMVGRILDGVCAVSDYIARRNVERLFLPRDKMWTIHNGIRPEAHPDPPRAAGGPVTISYAGQLIPEKGVLTLLRAVAMLADTVRYEMVVNIAGEGPQRPELEAFCRDRRLDNVRFLGHIDTIPDLFAASDVVVVPSVWAEAFGYVAIEAMACGAAVVTSDAGGLPEVVGDAGRVFRTADPASLADQLLALMRTPEGRARLARAGRARVIACFDLEQKVRQRIDLCKAVLLTPSPGQRGRQICP